MVLLGHLSGANEPLIREKTLIFGAPRLKKGPYRRFGGLNLLLILFVENMATKDTSHFSGFSLTFLFVK